jgi:hypothetical protein
MNKVGLTRFWSCAVFLGAVTLGSCSGGKSVEISKLAVANFHTQFNTNQYAKIYNDSDNSFHHDTTQEGLMKSLGEIHSRLGDVRDAELNSELIQWDSGLGTVVTLEYDTKFETGSGTERFAWIVEDNAATLHRYHISFKVPVVK